MGGNSSSPSGMALLLLPYSDALSLQTTISLFYCKAAVLPRNPPLLRPNLQIRLKKETHSKNTHPMREPGRGERGPTSGAPRRRTRPARGGAQGCGHLPRCRNLAAAARAGPPGARGRPPQCRLPSGPPPPRRQAAPPPRRLRPPQPGLRVLPGPRCSRRGERRARNLLSACGELPGPDSQPGNSAGYQAAEAGPHRGSRSLRPAALRTRSYLSRQAGVRPQRPQRRRLPPGRRIPAPSANHNTERAVGRGEGGWGRAAPARGARHCDATPGRGRGEGGADSTCGLWTAGGWRAS